MNNNKKNWIQIITTFEFVVPFVLFSLIVFFSLLMYRENRKTAQVKMVDEKAISDMDVMKSGKAMIWTGLTGEYPRFITTGSLIGLGYEEFPVYRMKKSLTRDYGIRILERYMTPARMEVEFRQSKYPICTYPHKWNNPLEKFKKASESLYSLPLDVGEDTKKYKIIFLKELKPHFSKHLDEKGNIKISSLLADNTLKATFINNVDYGEDVNKIIVKDQSGDPIIHSSFKKHIKLMVATNNRQLVQMMKGKRFHYTLADLITNEHFSMAKIKKDEFDTLTYEERPIHDIKDPNLVLFTIRCNKHPLSYKLMPVLNEQIKTLRSSSNVSRFVADMKDKLEDGVYSNPVSKIYSGVRTISDQINNGAIDWWYPYYSRHLPLVSEQLLPLKKTLKEKIIDVVIPKQNQKKEITFIPITLGNVFILLSKIDTLNLNLFESTFWNTLTSAEVNQVKKKLSENYSEMSIEEVLKSEYISKNRYERIIISGSYLKIKEQHEILVKVINKSTKGVSFLEGNLLDLNLSSLLKETVLENLDLSRSLISSKELNEIFQKHHENIKFLHLEGQKKIFNKEFMQKFVKLNWSNLKEINFSNADIFGENTSLLFDHFPKNIEKIYFSENSMRPNDFKQLIKIGKKLTHVCLGGMMHGLPFSAVSRYENEIILPQSLVELGLSMANIKEDQLLKIKFPKSLKRLNLTHNFFSDKGAKFLGKALEGTKIEELYLGNNNFTAFGAQELFFNSKKQAYPWIKNIKILQFTNLKLSDEVFMKLPLNKNIAYVDLESNRLTDLSLNKIKILKELKYLNLSSNLLTPPGQDKLLKLLPKEIESLILVNTLGFDSDLIGPKIPKSLRELNFSFSDLRAEQIKSLIEHLPKKITTLYLNKNGIDKNELIQLINKMPVNLHKLEVSLSQSTQDLLTTFIQNLPITLEKLTLNAPEWASNAENTPIIWPMGIKDLNLKIYSKNNMEEKIIQNLPLHLHSLTMAPIHTQKNILHLANVVSQMSLDYLEITISKSLDNEVQAYMNLLYDKLPPSISHVRIPGANIDVLTGTSSWKLPFNLSYFANRNIAPVLKTRKQQRRQFLDLMGCLSLGGPNINDNVINNLLSNVSLKNLWQLNLYGTTLTDAGLLNILKNINPELISFTLASSAIGHSNIDEILKHLPKKLLLIAFPGNKIGEKGMQKLREWKKLRENELGAEIELIE